jgi:hypothetical protein
METKFSENSEKISTKFYCKKCDYICFKKQHWKQHFETKKHKTTPGIINPNNGNHTEKQKLKCKCGKLYNNRSGLWKHTKKCDISNNYDLVDDDNEDEDENENDNDNSNKDNLTDKQLILMLIKDNQEFKNMMMEQNKTIMNLAEKAGTNNSYNNNKTFNLQLFLNETCKDAINLSDFVNQIQVSIGELEETGTLGYAEGISKVFIKNLNDIDYNMRPIHCSDSKRETLYIKDDNQWSKDDEQKSNLTKAIKQVAHKNMKQISEWQKLNPDYSNPDSKQNDRYQKIIFNSMSGSTKEESDKNYEKIAKNIAKQTVIEKI